MDVVFRVYRHVVIEDVAHVGDVQAARRHVTGDKKGDLAVAECLERGHALALVHIAMQCTDIELVPVERPVDDADIFLAVAEDDGVLDVDLLHQFAQGLPLRRRCVRCLLQALHDGRRGGCRRGNFDAFGSVKEIVGEALNFWRHGRREEEGLPREGKHFADALDIGNESHVEHSVGFIDHQDLDAVEQQLAALAVIEKAARRGNHHIGAAVQLLVLFVVGHAADEQRHRQFVVLAEKLEGLGDLGGKLACRLQDQRARHPRPGASTLQPRQHRQHEGGCLAGSGLGDAEHVAAGDRDRDGVRLNWGGGLEPCRFDGRDNVRA